ncbi:hypothetical protein EYF80_023447 [Liparis tanakae]|uniref:Uncharacterized protein n=1 Tax=Liparis tanakae TaxID=230148 RepID=A0A4Z2HLB3_9TELE|nr:hypothetical protein EYF80_023447 [Liparis tanakae]
MALTGRSRGDRQVFSLECLCFSAIWAASPLALDGAELVTLGEAEWLELRLEVDGLGCRCDDKNNNNNITNMNS